jgi:hypothetical protein
MKRRKLTSQENRETLSAFLPVFDETPTGGAIVPRVTGPRMSAMQRILSVQAATQGDVDRIAEADKRKAESAPDAGPEWIEPEPPK